MAGRIKAYWRLITCKQNRTDTLFVLLFMAFAVSADAIAEAVAVAVEEVLK